MDFTRPADSWYAASRRYALDLRPLEADLECEIVVIGAGITGCTTALHLAERGRSVALLEAGEVGWGASGRSGGQLIVGYGCEMEVLKKLVGRDSARRLWDLSEEAVAQTRARIEKHRIDCDLRQGHLHVAVKPRQVEELKAWERSLHEEYGYEIARFVGLDELEGMIGTKRYLAGLFDPGSGHLHPLNYTLGLAEAALEAGARIHPRAPVQAVERREGGWRVRTRRGAVDCAAVVYCCNAYLDGLEPRLDSRIMPVGTYIIATEPLGAERAAGLISCDAAVADINFVLDYFRLSADHRLLFGGRVSYSTLEPRRLTESMRRRMLKVYPGLADVKIDYTWGGYVAITRHRAPHIGRLEENLYFAQGFSGHGIALTGFAGKMIADAIDGDREKLDLFASIPQHGFPGGKWLRTPSLVLAMLYYRLRDLL